MLFNILSLMTFVISFAVAPQGRAAPSHYLRLYFMPAGPERIDWSSPKRLLLTTLDATAFNSNHAIGHVNIEIKCQGESLTPERHIYTGAVSQNRMQSGIFLANDKIAFSLLAIS